MKKNKYLDNIKRHRYLILNMLMFYLVCFIAVFSAFYLDKAYNEREKLNIFLDIYSRELQNHNYTLSEPTELEVLAFLYLDKTSLKTYDKEDYNCRHFSKDLMINAAYFGIRSAYVTIFYGNGSNNHAVVGFNTSDEGFIYVEPQTDKILDIDIGKKHEGIVIKDIELIWSDEYLNI